MKGILIGGAALVQLGSSRSTKDTDYLINDLSSKEMFGAGIVERNLVKEFFLLRVV